MFLFALQACENLYMPLCVCHPLCPWILPWAFLFILLFYTFFWLRREACGISVPWLGIEPGPPAVKAPSPNHWTAREVPSFLKIVPLTPVPRDTFWEIYTDLSAECSLQYFKILKCCESHISTCPYFNIVYISVVFEGYGNSNKHRHLWCIRKMWCLILILHLLSAHLY